MNGVNILIAVAVSTSIFALVVIFSTLYGNSQNENPQTMIAQIPAILQENDKDVEQNNLQITDKTQVGPLEAILLATKNVSAQPSDLRSIALETKDGYPVYSMDIFNSDSNNSVEVTVDAVNGKAVRTNQDLDDNANKIKKEEPDE
jgi:hypothetical protein